MQEEQKNLNQVIHELEQTKREPSQSERTKTTINHVDTANAAIKMVMLAPLHDKIKRIMILRIGSPILKQRAMSHLAIALQLGMREEEVFRLEMEGIQIVRDFMEKVCLTDSVAKFNKDGSEAEVRNTLSDIA